MRFRDRNASGLHGARRVVSCVLICCLCAACSDASRPSRQAAGGSSTPATTSARPTVTPLPIPSSTNASTADPSQQPAIQADPYTKNPATLARELDTANATLDNQDATQAKIGKAAEFQQLAVGSLANSSATFRRTVIGDLDPKTAQLTRTQLKASQALATISDPQQSLPDWRIVRPASPDDLLRDYREAQRRTGVNWTYLAAIQLIETRMGRIRGTSSAGAQGPMQFTRPTWQLYGDGGDINNDRDAILAAARLLQANGAPADMDAALWHYNPVAGYVRAVDAYARTMRTSPSAYYAYWHWQVIFSYPRGSFILPVGYPKNPAVRLPD